MMGDEEGKPAAAMGDDEELIALYYREIKPRYAAVSQRLADYDQACEDCLSKQFIRDRLTALWTAHAENQNHWLRTAVADVAEALGVPLECAKRKQDE